MKKFLVIAAMVLASATSFAQQAAGSFSVTPKVGRNIASLTDNKDSDPRFGLAAGAEFMYQASDIASVSCRTSDPQRACKERENTEKHD